MARKAATRVPTANEDSIVAGIVVTHPDRLLWPDGEITKLELARYYAAIAPKLLAHSGDRPISLVRCPRGPGQQCFFQRHASEGMPPQVRAVRVADRGDGKPFIYIDDVQGLVSLVQVGTIELHAWNAPASDAKHPDRLIFDLDPGPKVTWAAVRKAALELHDALKQLGLVAFLKTTGGKGLHIVVPFSPGPTWADAKRSARTFCARFAERSPERFTINPRKNLRVGRIFLDYLRNDETASAVAAYSVRARPGAPVSLPIEWKELTPLKSGDAFKIEDALRRRKDPWAAMNDAGRQRLPELS